MRYVEQLQEIFSSLFTLFDLKIIGAAGLGFLSFLFGVESATAMYALITLMVIDLIMGTAAAAMKGEVSSRKASKTPIKFGVYLLLASAAHLADTAAFSGLYLQETMIAFLALTELISVLENAGKMGIAVPKQLSKRLAQLRDEK